MCTQEQLAHWSTNYTGHWD